MGGIFQNSANKAPHAPIVLYDKDDGLAGDHLTSRLQATASTGARPCSRFDSAEADRRNLTAIRVRSSGARPLLANAAARLMIRSHISSGDASVACEIISARRFSPNSSSLAFAASFTPSEYRTSISALSILTVPA